MRRLRQWGRRRVIIAACAVVVVLGALVAATTDDVQRREKFASRDAATAVLPAPTAGDETAISGMAAASTGAGGGSGGELRTSGPVAVSPPVAPQADGQKVIRTANLQLEVRRGSFDDAFRRASEVASSHGGFVAGSTSSTAAESDERSFGTVSLRIPGDRFDAALRTLSELGKVKAEQQSGTDVSGQLVDLGARLASARVQEDALRALMGRANTVGETLQVQEQLGRIRQEIEQLSAQQAHLQDEVAMAKIDVSLAEPGAAVTAPPDESTGLARSLERAVDGAVAVVGGTIVVLGYLLPLLLLGLLAWLAVRISGSVGRRRAPSAPVSAG